MQLRVDSDLSQSERYLIAHETACLQRVNIRHTSRVHTYDFGAVMPEWIRWQQQIISHRV